MFRAFNFGSGPAALPQSVLEKAQRELLNWNQRGMSILEIGHRTPDFMQKVAEKSESDLRSLLNVPDNYHILFLAGGGQTQFGMVPLNLLARNKNLVADYINSGIWSEKAIQEAKRYGNIHIAADCTANQFTCIPQEDAWQLTPDAAYLHYTDNETIGGLRFPFIPTSQVPLVADMTSSLLSEPLDVSRFGIIYAGAQKNISAAGLTIVIIRDDLIGQALPFTPTLWNYQTHRDAHSLFNTPPVFSWYLASLVFEWLKEQGGLGEMQKRNQEKAQLLYKAIDTSEGFYKNPIHPSCRSLMNIPFTLPTTNLEQQFLNEAQQQHLMNLKGHKLVGGIRASIYNAVSLDAVKTLVTFMQSFAKQHHKDHL